MTSHNLQSLVKSLKCPQCYDKIYPHKPYEPARFITFTSSEEGSCLCRNLTLQKRYNNPNNYFIQCYFDDHYTWYIDVDPNKPTFQLWQKYDVTPTIIQDSIPNFIFQSKAEQLKTLELYQTFS